jgi:tartrate-resistant acid phosphatase type 5
MDDGVKAGGGREWSRRQFLLQTAKFSALALLSSPLALAELPVPATPADPKSNHILMLGDWGTVTGSGQQLAVADAMKRWASDNSIRPDALLMLGDNFYGQMPDGVNSRRWIEQFEQMYPSSLFPGPAYAVLGNHDYETFRGNKVEAQLAYTRQSSRWMMPQRWYSVKLPKENPLLTLICLDSNIPGSKGLDLSPWSFVLTRQQHNDSNNGSRQSSRSPVPLRF